MDSGKSGQNQGHHVIEHHLINKSRGDYFFEKVSFFWDTIWDMLLVKPERHMFFKHNFSVSTYNFCSNNLLVGQIRIQTGGPATR